MTASRLAFAPASQDGEQPDQGRQAAEAVDRRGGELIGIGLGQHDAMDRERQFGHRGDCRLNVGEAGHVGQFIQGGAGPAKIPAARCCR